MRYSSKVYFPHAKVVSGSYSFRIIPIKVYDTDLIVGHLLDIGMLSGFFSHHERCHN